MNRPKDEGPNPFQAVDWRWQLARDLVENTAGPFRSCKDSTVRLARRFWGLRKDCRNEADRRLLGARMPTVYRAFSIYTDHDNLTRATVEARVLAGEAPSAIARKGATTPAVIQLFEELFFSVRPHLGCIDYILNQVLGPRLRESTGGWDYDLLWKFYAYLGGELVLEDIMDAAPLVRPRNFEEVETFLSEDARAVLRRQLALATRLFRGSDTRTTAELLKMQARLAAGKAAGQEEGSPQNPFEKHVEAMLQEIPWVVGNREDKTTPPKVAEYDVGAAELRADELQRLASGQEPPDLKSLKELRMPPPRPRTQQQSLLEDDQPLR